MRFPRILSTETTVGTCGICGLKKRQLKNLWKIQKPLWMVCGRASFFLSLFLLSFQLLKERDIQRGRKSTCGKMAESVEKTGVAVGAVLIVINDLARKHAEIHRFLTLRVRRLAKPSRAGFPHLPAWPAIAAGSALAASMRVNINIILIAC